MGYMVPPPVLPHQWSQGSCDVMAVALHRMYGLPLMAEFERGEEDGREVLGYLRHAWVRLPDGRALDASGPREMFVEADGGDPDDAWVKGGRIVEIPDDDPHLLNVREEVDYVDAIRDMRVPQWISDNLGQYLSALGLEPTGYRDVLGLPPPGEGDGTEEPRSFGL